MSIDLIGTRISKQDFARRLRANGKDYTYVIFREGVKYAISAGVRHQVIRDSNRVDIGIAISRNGSIDFRQYDRRVVYGRYMDAILEFVEVGGEVLVE